MASLSIIKDIISYLGDPNKYRVGKYDQGSNENLIAIYRIGDIYDMITTAQSNADLSISEKISNLTSQLYDFGYETMSREASKILSIADTIEGVRALDKAYRTIWPIVDRAADIGGIKFNFAEIAKIAQDVLEYIGRELVGKAIELFWELWRRFLQTPLFAVYLKNNDIVDISDTYSNMYNDSQKLISNLSTEDITKALKLILNDAKMMLDPEYISDEVITSDDIIDTFYVENDMILIASEHDIYKYDLELKDYYSVFSNNDIKINKILYSDNRIFIIHNENHTLRCLKENSIETDWENEYDNKINIIYSEPVLIEIEGSIYELLNSGINFITNTIGNSSIITSTFDYNNETIYYVEENSDVYTLSKDLEQKFTQHNKYDFDLQENTINSIAYFNNKIYISLYNQSTKKSKIVSIQTLYSFSSFKYEMPNGQYVNNSILMVSDDLLSNGKNIYSYNKNICNFLTNTGTSHVNSISKHTYNNKDYIIGTSGVYFNIVNVNSGIWSTKIFDYIGNESGIEEYPKAPEVLGNILWDNNSLFVCSNNRIYFLEEKLADKLFEQIEEKEPEDLEATKVFKEYSRYRTENSNQEDVSLKLIKYSCYTDIPENSIITNINKIKSGKQEHIYVSLYNKITKDSTINEIFVNVDNGIYSCGISEQPSFEIEKCVIYTFDKYKDYWYYSDGTSAYKVEYKTKKISFDTIIDSDERIIKLKVDDEGYLYIYTNKSLITNELTGSFSNISSSVAINLNNKISLFNSKGSLLISDDEFVYNSIINEDKSINFDVYQIVFEPNKNLPWHVIQNVNSTFIANANILEWVPINSKILSSKYFCGYNTDTALTTWENAAPYYLSEKVLDNKRYKGTRVEFISNFKENFKFELKKLLTEIPDLFIIYSKSLVKNNLQSKSYSIKNDDNGVILSELINAVANNTTNSMAVFLQSKITEKLNDDGMYELFSLKVFNECINDIDNNMTDDFYKVAFELLKEILDDYESESHGDTDNKLEQWIITYYQDHKQEWVDSMMEFIFPNIVDPEIYEFPLKYKESVKQTTYTFSYPDNKYYFEFDSNIMNHHSEDEIKYGYYKNNKFYVDRECTIELDPKYKNNNDYYLDEELTKPLCYYNSFDEKYYKEKFTKYIQTNDSEILLGKTYYKKFGDGDNRFIYTVVEPNEAFDPNKEYYIKNKYETKYKLTDDTELNYSKQYYILNNKYALTNDIIIKDKQYYTHQFVPATVKEDGIQYYSYNFVLTNDTEIVSNKEYYTRYENYEDGKTYIPCIYDGSEYKRYIETKDNPFLPTETYYTFNINKNIFEEVDKSKDSSYYETYYKLIKQDGIDKIFEKEFKPLQGNIQEDVDYYKKFVNVKVEDSDIVLDGYYKTSDLRYPGSLYYVEFNEKTTPAINTLYYYEETNNETSYLYSYVSSPSKENLKYYFEKKVALDYPKGDDITGLYIDKFTEVINPIQKDLYMYYEYIDGDNFIPVLEPNNSEIGCYYEQYRQYIDTSSYMKINNNEFNEEYKNNRWYYTRVWSKEEYVKYVPVSSEELEECFEYTEIYAKEYTDNSIYIDLGANEIDATFKEEDDKWQVAYYLKLEEAKSKITSSDLLEAKAQANNAVISISHLIYPSWIWQELISRSVKLYLTKQEQQYKDIIKESNMYPIQWQELDPFINKSKFDTALTLVLDAVKEQLYRFILEMINTDTMKCYSCIDSASIIQYIIREHGAIWLNQRNIIINKIKQAKTVDEVKKSLDIVHIYVDSYNLLEERLNKQSNNFAKLIDEMMYKVIISDIETEVKL